MEIIDFHWLRNAFLDDPNLHRIGRIVFLGVPFFFVCRHRLVASALLTLYLVILSLLFYALPYWFILFGLAPLWLVPVGATIAWILSQPMEFNYYFDELPCARKHSKAPRHVIESLVISAPLFDEASIVLSSGPFLWALLGPSFKNEIVWKLRWRVDDAHLLSDAEVCVKHFVNALINGFKIVTYPVGCLLTFLIRRYIWRIVYKAILSRMLGVNIAIVNRIRVSTMNAGLPFSEVVQWDVSHLVREVPFLVPKPKHEETFAFLSCEDQIERRLTGSRMWASVARAVSEMSDAGVLALDGEMLSEIKHKCLIIEDRIGDISKSLQTAHSIYHRHPAIIAAIAKFLVSGMRPPLP